MMGKRSTFDRIDRDFYPTPYEAVVPLFPHLSSGYITFDEPCCGDGKLVGHIEGKGHICKSYSDIEPRVNYGKFINVFDKVKCQGDMFITNPPWDRKILHPLITHLSRMAPTWLLFDADWMHTKQSADLIKYCSKIVSVGRVKWIPDSKMTGKDNCAWYLFDREVSKTEFIGR